MNRQMSLRARLLMTTGVVTLFALVLADLFVYAALRSELNRQVDTSLSTATRAIAQFVNHPNRPLPGGIRPALGDGPGPSVPSVCSIGLQRAPGIFVEVRSPQGGVVTSNGAAAKCPAFQPGAVSFSPKLPATIPTSSTSFDVAASERTGPEFRVAVSQLPNGVQLIVAQPIASIANTLGQLRWVELLVTTLALVTAIVLGMWLVRVGLRPLRDVERTAEAITGGDFNHRVPNANDRTEVGHVATALNVMLERIAVAFDELRASERRSRQFVADASHELRTPLTAVSAYAQLFSRGASTRTEDLQRVMSGIERESDRMTRLVNDLLALTKLDEHRLGEQELLDIVTLIGEAAETATVVGPAWPIELDLPAELFVRGDRLALRQVVDNLLANVRAHTPEGTHVKISAGAEKEMAYLEVADDGPGIPKDAASSVFDRFVRLDPSRSRLTGGSGLGLAIVASIAVAHGGRATVQSDLGNGAAFRVFVPRPDDVEVVLGGPEPR